MAARFSAKPWLYRIAHNIVIDQFRRGGKWSNDDSVNPDDQLTDSQPLDVIALLQDCVDRLKALLTQLPQVQRDAFLLKEEAGLSLAEIGEINGVGRETIKSRLRYANKQLRQGLEGCE